MYLVYIWGLGITSKTPSDGHASLGMTQPSHRLTLIKIFISEISVQLTTIATQLKTK